MHASSRKLRDKMIDEFNECIDSAAMCMLRVVLSPIFLI